MRKCAYKNVCLVMDMEFLYFTPCYMSYYGYFWWNELLNYRDSNLQNCNSWQNNLGCSSSTLAERNVFYRVTYNVYVPVTFTHLVVRVHYILGLAKLNADVKSDWIVIICLIDIIWCHLQWLQMHFTIKLLCKYQPNCLNNYQEGFKILMIPNLFDYFMIEK